MMTRTFIEFRGASSKYLEQFIQVNKAVKHELVENYRSKSNLVQFTNQFVTRIRHRLKEIPIVAKQTDNGKIKIVRYQSGNLITPLCMTFSQPDLQELHVCLQKQMRKHYKSQGCF